MKLTVYDKGSHFVVDADDEVYFYKDKMEALKGLSVKLGYDKAWALLEGKPKYTIKLMKFQ